MTSHHSSFSTTVGDKYFESNNKLKVMETEEKWNMDKIIEQNEIIIKQNRMIISMLSPKVSRTESAKEKYKKSILSKS